MESTDEREARLQRVRSAQEQRIAAESTDESEARIQRVRSAQEQRIAAESTDERRPSSSSKECSGTEDCCGVNG